MEQDSHAHDELNNEELLCEFRQRKQLYRITKMTYVWILLSGFLYLVDVISDLVLGMRYLATGQWILAALTFLFVNGSSVLYNWFNRSATWRKYVSIQNYFKVIHLVQILKRIIKCQKYLSR